MSKEFKQLYLTNGNVKLKLPKNLRQRVWEYNGKREVYYQCYGSYGSENFHFTNPEGTTYFKILLEFYNNPEPMRLTDAKEAVGINRRYWTGFNTSVVNFGILEKIPNSWSYKLTKLGETYVSEVLSGRSKWEIVS